MRLGRSRIEPDGDLQMFDRFGDAAGFEIAAAKPRALVRIVRRLANPDLRSADVVEDLSLREVLRQCGGFRARERHHLKTKVAHLVARLRSPGNGTRRMVRIRLVVVGIVVRVVHRDCRSARKHDRRGVSIVLLPVKIPPVDLQKR